MWIYSDKQKQSVLRILKYMKDGETEIDCSATADAPCLDEDFYIEITYLWYVEDPEKVFDFLSGADPLDTGETLLYKLVKTLDKKHKHYKDVQNRYLKARKAGEYAPSVLEDEADEIKMALEDYGNENSLKGIGLAYGGAVCGNTQVD